MATHPELSIPGHFQKGSEETSLLSFLGFEKNVPMKYHSHRNHRPSLKAYAGTYINMF